MSILALAIVNNHNTPVLIRTKNEDSIDLLFKLHSSLDVIDEKQNTREPFLGILTQSDHYKIYGLCSATNNKILLMVNNNTTTIRDNEARSILKTIHHAYVDVITLNPFYVHGQPIHSQ
ncbi:trafficking protein particle complex subunit 2-like protein [Euroglyphus maynei]|uniref:Trafficking protein particle complex subunit 2-like protein n=1 Tax=Euroglyphus maynei TaxID=6958 RepID=A0A1Y3BEH7_EURMA|nr:trafficking protein particle complex subunit 2-like protein [Euroglyphus maynei]